MFIRNEAIQALESTFERMAEARWGGGCPDDPPKTYEEIQAYRD